MQCLLKNADLPPFLDWLSGRLEVIAAVNVDGFPSFVEWEGQPQAPVGENSQIPPTRILFPQREVLFRYVQESGSYVFEQDPPKTRVLFGVRPCDLRAISILDKIFFAEPKDSAYLGRRASTLIIGMNCVVPCKNGFCAPFGTGPVAGEVADLILTDIGDAYFAESMSPAGMLLMKERPDLFLEAPPDALKMKRKAISSCREEIMRSKGQKTPQLVKDALTKADWEGMGRSCISCGGCSYVCPTCHCFNISDQGTPDGERVRCADTCILSGFSRMTSGVNPRRSAGERLRNWFMDKFEFIPRRTGLLGCVGCGRCSVVCLSGSDRWEWLL